MINNKHKDPLHGITLEMILPHLVEKYGWEEMSRRIRINCFAKNPIIKSSRVKKEFWLYHRGLPLYNNIAVLLQVSEKYVRNQG